MPKNTRVGRCVGKLTRKYGYGGAISICQKSITKLVHNPKNVHLCQLHMPYKCGSF